MAAFTKLARHTYAYAGMHIALAPGTYDPEDDASIEAKLAEVSAEADADNPDIN